MPHLTALLSLLVAGVLLVACGATGQIAGDSGRNAPTATSEPAPTSIPVPAAGSLADITRLNAHAGIRTDCQVDSDCAVVDVGNCCGSYPMCVRAGSQADPAAVRAECEKHDLAGICGFPVIDACVCDTGRCQAVQSGTGAVR